MDLNLWLGGVAQLPDCGECLVDICPAPHRMSAHRRRSPYNLGYAFDYLCDVNRRACYDQLVADDTVWLALVPEDSLLEAIRAKVTVPDASAEGTITWTVLAETISLDDCGAAVTTPIVLGAPLDVAHDTLAVASFFLQESPMLYTNPYGPSGREGIRVGLQINTFGTGGLQAFKGRVELTVVARDLETAQIADCRGNACVIDNP